MQGDYFYYEPESRLYTYLQSIHMISYLIFIPLSHSLKLYQLSILFKFKTWQSGEVLYKKYN